eukprot:1890400-Rhodomonas_salina.1
MSGTERASGSAMLQHKPVLSSVRSGWGGHSVSSYALPTRSPVLTLRIVVWQCERAGAAGAHRRAVPSARALSSQLPLPPRPQLQRKLRRGVR